MREGSLIGPQEQRERKGLRTGKHCFFDQVNSKKSTLGKGGREKSFPRFQRGGLKKESDTGHQTFREMKRSATQIFRKDHLGAERKWERTGRHIGMEKSQQKKRWL